MRFLAQPDGRRLTHRLILEAEALDGDVVFEQHGVVLAVSASQAELVAGTSLDFVGDGEQGSFVVSNPNAVAKLLAVSC